MTPRAPIIGRVSQKSVRVSHPANAGDAASVWMPAVAARRCGEPRCPRSSPPPAHTPPSAPLGATRAHGCPRSQGPPEDKVNGRMLNAPLPHGPAPEQCHVVRCGPRAVGAQNAKGTQAPQESRRTRDDHGTVWRRARAPQDLLQPLRAQRDPNAKGTRAPQESRRIRGHHRTVRRRARALQDLLWLLRAKRDQGTKRTPPDRLTSMTRRFGPGAAETLRGGGTHGTRR
jgi:hypothetical protein